MRLLLFDVDIILMGDVFVELFLEVFVFGEEFLGGGVFFFVWEMRHFFAVGFV